MLLKGKDFPTWLKVILTCIGVTSAFLIYLIAIGIPKTQARNYYNQALIAQSIDQSDLAQSLLDKAYSAWPEAYFLKFPDLLVD
jgi:uncharacterized membrane protein YgaE (UPF0421/DUF939 family)